MNRKSLSKAVALLFTVAFLASLASCHRGYGCPTNLSTGVKIIKTIVNR